MKLDFKSPSTYHFIFIRNIVYSSSYSSLPSFTALSLNFDPAETSLSTTFLIIKAVSENDVVILLVLFLAIITMAITSDIRVTPKAAYKSQWGKYENQNMRVKKSDSRHMVPKEQRNCIDIPQFVGQRNTPSLYFPTAASAMQQ